MIMASIPVRLLLFYSRIPPLLWPLDGLQGTTPVSVGGGPATDHTEGTMI